MTEHHYLLPLAQSSDASGMILRENHYMLPLSPERLLLAWCWDLSHQQMFMWPQVYERGFRLWLRNDSPMCNCCSHGTLLHVSPQGSHLSICYYHQDLCRWQLQAGLHPDPSTLTITPPYSLEYTGSAPKCQLHSSG